MLPNILNVFFNFFRKIKLKPKNIIIFGGEHLPIYSSPLSQKFPFFISTKIKTKNPLLCNNFLSFFIAGFKKRIFFIKLLIFRNCFLLRFSIFWERVFHHWNSILIFSIKKVYEKFNLEFLENGNLWLIF